MCNYGLLISRTPDDLRYYKMTKFCYGRLTRSARASKEMEMYGMFIVEDPIQVLIKHFRNEFNHYWYNEATPLNLRGLRS